MLKYIWDDTILMLKLVYLLYGFLMQTFSSCTQCSQFANTFCHSICLEGDYREIYTCRICTWRIPLSYFDGQWETATEDKVISSVYIPSQIPRSTNSIERQQRRRKRKKNAQFETFRISSRNFFIKKHFKCFCRIY